MANEKRIETINLEEDFEKDIEEAFPRYNKINSENRNQLLNLISRLAKAIDETDVAKILNSCLPEGYKLKEVVEPQFGYYWRGMDPIDSLYLIGVDQKDHLSVKEPKFGPNASSDWTDAIRHGVGKSIPIIPFNLAVGFKESEKLKIKSEKTSPVYRGNLYKVNGEINFKDLQYLAIRMHGEEPGKVGRLRAFEIEKGEE